MESPNAIFPRHRLRILPALIAFGHRQRPVEQIPQMRQNLSRHARPFGNTKRCEFRGRIPQRLAAAISKRRQCVPQKLALLIGSRIVCRCRHSFALGHCRGAPFRLLLPGWGFYNSAVPTGLHAFKLRYPALKRWANLFRAYGAVSTSRAFSQPSSTTARSSRLTA